MHHVIWVEHDGSWTWSIEEGKAFEDSHKVLARDEGFPTRGDAKDDMLKAWARLIDGGKRPGRPGQGKTTAKTKPPAKKTSASTKKTTTAAVEPTMDSTLPEWAIVVDGAIVALFAQKSAAQKYAKTNHEGNYRLQQITLGIIAR